jgi:hypothetical protein
VKGTFCEKYYQEVRGNREEIIASMIENNVNLDLITLPAEERKAEFVYA